MKNEWIDGRPLIGYTVKAPNHWVFEPLQLQLNKVIGEADALVGYECHGCLFADDGNGNLFATGGDHSPTNFQVLAITPLVNGPSAVWQREAPFIGQDQIATMGLYISDSGSTVFNAATTDWARLLVKGSAETRNILGTITRNVLTRLGRQTGPASLATLAQIVAVDGFFSPDDNYRHAIVATADGNISEIFFNPQQGQGQVVLAGPDTLPDNLVDVAAFYSDDDQFRHAIVATADGNVTEIFYSPRSGSGRVVLANVPNAIRVSAFFAPDDLAFSRRVVIATSDGTIREIKYSPASGLISTDILNVSGAIDVGGFFSSDDRYRHAIVAASDGNVQEIFYKP